MVQCYCVCLFLFCILLISVVLVVMIVFVFVYGDVFGVLQMLDKVVVIVFGFEQKVVDVLVSISVVSCEEFSKCFYINLVDVLCDVEGIDVGLEVIDKNGCVIIFMCGLLFEYILVLIDGCCQSNVGQLYLNNFGGGQFVYLLLLDVIECIEVVCGLMFILYGLDVMGGVINIIICCNQDCWQGVFIQGFSVQQDDQFGDVCIIDLYFSGLLLKDCFSLVVCGSYYDVKVLNLEWDVLILFDGSLWECSIGFGGGGKLVVNINWNIGVCLDFCVNDDYELWLDYDVLWQKYDNCEGQIGMLDSLVSFWCVGNVVIFNLNGSGIVICCVVQLCVGYIVYQCYECDQLLLIYQGCYSFGIWQILLIYSKSSNLGCLLLLILEECVNLQMLWNDVCCCIGVVNYCVVG